MPTSKLYISKMNYFFMIWMEYFFHWLRNKVSEGVPVVSKLLRTYTKIIGV